MSDENLEKKDDEQPAADNPENTDAEVAAESEAAANGEEKGEKDSETSDSDSTKPVVDSEPSESSAAAEVTETSEVEQPVEAEETSEAPADAVQPAEESTDESDRVEGTPQAETPQSGLSRPTGADRGPADRGPAIRGPADRGPADRPRGPYRGPGPQRPGSYGQGGDQRMDGDGDRSRGGRYKVYFRKKVCKFCTRKIAIHYLDYEALRRFTTGRGKMLPARITGNCAKHQRQLSKAIKRARSLALLPFVTK